MKFVIFKANYGLVNSLHSISEAFSIFLFDSYFQNDLCMVNSTSKTPVSMSNYTDISK